MKPRFEKFLSHDNPKAVKAGAFGYLNGINYMAPHNLAGVGNLCSHASAGCISLCLGDHSGQAAMSQKVKQSRIFKARYFMRERPAFMAEFALHCAKLYRKAQAAGLKAVIRPNGSTDIAFEGVAFEIPESIAQKISGIMGREFPAQKYRNIFEAFPEIQFLDYTKNAKRFERALPANYHLTFSLSETNRAEAEKVLKRGANVAVVFADRIPPEYLEKPTINGDDHDLRFLDPAGVIVGLSPKGNKAKKDKSGFVVRL
jgi:hypothetical protein